MKPGPDHQRAPCDICGARDLWHVEPVNRWRRVEHVGLRDKVSKPPLKRSLGRRRYAHPRRYSHAIYQDYWEFTISKRGDFRNAAW